MALATLIITPAQSTMRVSTTQAFASLASGKLALIDNNEPDWQNLDNCALQPDGSLKKTAATFAWDSGARSVETIAAGDGSVAWIANVTSFGGRLFAAGLTAQALVSSYAHIDFCLVCSESGVSVYESGVLRGTFRAARAGGTYQVGIENGRVTYRADGDVIYRSALAPAYPLSFGASFYNPLDSIGGDPDDGVVTWEARKPPSAPTYGSFSTNTSNTVWTAPNSYGLYTITARTANNLIGAATAHVLKLFPREEDGLPKPGKFLELERTWRVNVTEYDDEAADYALPYEHEGVRRWRLEWNTRTLSQTQAALLDSFWEQHKTAIPFYFYNWRTGETADFVRFAKEPTKDHRKVWRQQRVVELIRRPL